MVRIIKTVDRALAEAKGVKGRPISHLQTPHAAPGEREAVCVHGESGKKEQIVYGVDLERQIAEARRWVREGEGAKPIVVRRAGGELEITGQASGGEVVPLEEAGLVLGKRPGLR